jgi:hypothetical protein
VHTLLLILTRLPQPSTLHLADELAKISQNEVIIISDNKPQELPSVAKCVYIDDAAAREHGFVNSNPTIPKTPTAWDKAIYYLAIDRRQFEYVWIVEDDVFFTGPNICINLMEKYAGDTADLIVRNFFLREQHPRWPHWHFAEHFQGRHQAGAFLPLCRLSRRMIELAGDFVRKRESLDFIEVMFPSLAMSNMLRVRIMNFISERRFHAGPEFRKLELLQLWGDNLENGIFHPVKREQLRSISHIRPPRWELLFCRIVGPFLTRRSQLDADLRANAYSLTESQIRSMVDDRPL